MASFVGRTQELERLNARLDRALAGQGGVVVVTGDAGAGKSTLVQQFLVAAALRCPEARVIGAGCSEQYGAGEPYQPFVEAFRDLIGGQEPEQGKRSLRELAGELAPYWIQAIPIAGNIIAAGITTAVELKKTMGGVATATSAPSEEQLFFQYTELFFAAAAQQPIILFIDDLHWADRATVALLTHLARRIEEERVFILGTYRPVDVDVGQHPIRQALLELERYRVAEQLALEPLDTAALADFIREELEAPPTPKLLRWLERRAGTNPLFFGELLRWLSDRGCLGKRHDEMDLVREPEEVEIPRSAESTIERRLERLDAEIYKILEYASVEGNEFGSTSLAQLLGMDELDLEESLDPLVKVHRLIRLTDTRDLPNGDIASIYVFSHSLIQDVLHNNLQGKRRILLHRKMAQILEETYAGDTGAIAHRLAIHYDEGRQADRAFTYAVEAADRLAQVFAHLDALEILRRAEKNASTDEQRAAVLARRGESHRLIGRYAEALEDLSGALQLAEARGERLEQLVLKYKIVTVERGYGARPVPEIVALLDEMNQEARDLQAHTELCHILWLYRGLRGAGAPRDVEHAREALALAEQVGEAGLIAKAHYELGNAVMFQEDPATAIPHFAHALQAYQQLDHKSQVGMCHNCIAIAHTLSGDYPAASRGFKAAASAFDKLGDPVNESSVRSNLGALLTRLGEYHDAGENLREALRLLDRMDASVRKLFVLQNLAELGQARGDLEAARRHWSTLAELATATGYTAAQVIAHCGLGTTALEEGNLATAREAEAFARGRLDGDEWTESREAFQFLAARLAAADGRDDEAVTLLEVAERELENRDRYLWAVARLYHAEVVGKTAASQGVVLAGAARETFANMGAVAMRDRAGALLERLGGEA